VAAAANASIKLLQRLCLACGVSGDEGEIRRIVLSEVRPFADDVRVDALGNVLAIRHGRRRHPVRVMMAAHMDEVGFMLVADEGDGLYRFESVGGIDSRQLPGSQVVVGRDHIPAVIGARPIHLTTTEERGRRIASDTLRIDLGPGGKAKIGDRATFAPNFRRVGPSIFSKALDNRLGVGTLIELFKASPKNVELLAAFTVQEEIGPRGAGVAARTFAPDLAFAVDATPANDLPAWDGQENTAYNTRLGFGPAIYTMDRGTLSDPRLTRFLAGTAQAAKIPFQFRQPGGGGTDAGAIHRQLAGIPSASISTPHRYTHTALSVARLADWINTLRLLNAALKRLGPQVLREDRN
jgi:putative aminopeptidase FrvX